MLPPVLAHIQSLGHEVFTSGDYNLNLFGIRSSDYSSGEFNDLMGCAYKADGQWIVAYWVATTDPGTYYRENPMNVNGTAILVPGQYRSAWKIGKHRGSYDALVQIAPVKVYRDNNLDSILDHVGEEAGLYGINLHASSSQPYDEGRDRDASEEVSRWSAGCQVHATVTGFREMMKLANKQIAEHPTWAQKFTYTLVDQWW